MHALCTNYNQAGNHACTLHKLQICAKCMHGFLLDSHQLFRQCNVHDGEVVPKSLAQIKQETMNALCIHVAAIHVFP